MNKVTLEHSNTIKGHFVPSTKGDILLTQFGELSKTAILCLPSFAEELNLARAVVAKQAQYFAANQLPCVILDYTGTGDSQGEFEQVTPNDWLDDILAAGRWLQLQGVENIVLWGLRFGSLLAMVHQDKLLSELPIVAQLHWKPVTNGKQFASQFIRIKQANSMMNQSSEEKINWREHILAGNPTEIAGYSINASMLNALDQLKVPADFIPKVPFLWLELAANAATPAVTRFTNNWPEASYQLICQQTPAFWQVPEVFDLPDLYAISPAFLQNLEGV
ncbi:hypothetical protein [uncultured Paraglaciecola sp.]|mgnify:CR=1 FL=1|uniref:hypothetical protein n=1 Tax=uncultured Paraglaciecola sp. TaxID=1765024 RepID=UPI0026194D5E|nr:hypothetical protein [uncultured Paraglaciecola sp.]